MTSGVKPKRPPMTLQGLDTFAAWLQTFADTYGIRHPKSTVDDEDDSIHRLANDYLKAVSEDFYGEKLTATDEEVGHVCYAFGRLSNIASECNRSTQQMLEDAVRFVPMKWEAWYELAKCASKFDCEYALKCLEMATTLSPTPEVKTMALHAVVLRQKANATRDATAASKLYEQALTIARTAAEIAPDCGEVQMTLGTGLFYEFFKPTSTANRVQAGDVISCYKKALGCADQTHNAVIRLNLATILKFTEAFNESFYYMQEAWRLDPRNTFFVVDEYFLHAAFFTTILVVMGRIGVTKRLAKLAVMKRKLTRDVVDECFVGRTGEGLVVKGMDDLLIGANPNAVLFGTVMSIIPQPQYPPVLLICDEQLNICPVFLYNFAATLSFAIGDRVAIAAPEARREYDIELLPDWWAKGRRQVRGRERVSGLLLEMARAVAETEDALDKHLGIVARLNPLLKLDWETDGFKCDAEERRDVDPEADDDGISEYVENAHGDQELAVDGASPPTSRFELEPRPMLDVPTTFEPTEQPATIRAFTWLHVDTPAKLSRNFRPMPQGAFAAGVLAISHR